MIDYGAVLGALARGNVEFILLGGVAGGGGFEALRPHCAAIRIFGVDCLCPDLDTLIALKRAAGRPKDLEAIAELESLRDEKGR